MGNLTTSMVRFQNYRWHWRQRMIPSQFVFCWGKDGNFSIGACWQGKHISIFKDPSKVAWRTKKSLTLGSHGYHIYYIYIYIFQTYVVQFVVRKSFGKSLQPLEDWAWRAQGSTHSLHYLAEAPSRAASMFPVWTLGTRVLPRGESG